MTEHAIARREAAEWFVIMHDAQEPSAESLQAWLRWLEASEENQRAFENIAHTWHAADMGSIAPAATQADDGYDGSISVAQWRGPVRVGKFSLRFWKRSTLRGAGVAMAASLVLCAVALYIFKPTPISSGEFVTRTAEHLELKLSDGSVVTLGAHSRLVVDFNRSLRELRLDEGEAFFSVQKDPRRPFTVLALDGAITAIGTAFNVRALDDRVIVTVAEGAVKMADGKPILRGQQLIYRPQNTAASTTLQKVDPDESSRWREGWLVYRREPLRDVIADMARYTELKFKMDASVGDQQFTGIVSKDRIAEWIAALPEVSPVSVESQGSWFTIKGRSPTIPAQP